MAITIAIEIVVAILNHSKLIPFGIRIAITFVIGSTIGAVDHYHQALAYMRPCPFC